ncbi:MAG: phage holin family protein [Clostridium sp.]
MDFMNFIIEKCLILIPALYILGCILKKAGFIKDKYIPIILLPLGILGAIAINGISIESTIQGILVTGATVYSNQVCKQIKKDKPKENNNT